MVNKDEYIIIFHLIRQMAPPVGDTYACRKNLFHIRSPCGSTVALIPSGDIVSVLPCCKIIKIIITITNTGNYKSVAYWVP